MPITLDDMTSVDDGARFLVNEALEKAVAFRDLLYYMHEEIKNRMKNRRNDNFKVVLRVFKEGYPGLLKN